MLQTITYVRKLNKKKTINGTYALRGVKDWVHMKTTQNFNWFCNLDMNQKLAFLIIKVVYHRTLHNKIISPTHFIVYMLWWPTPTWFNNKNA